MARRIKKHRKRNGENNTNGAPVSPQRQGLVFACLLTAIVLLFFPVRYEVNDDHSVIQTLAGFDGFSPSDHVPFMSRPLAWGISWAYRAAPTIAWLGIGIYLTTALAIATLARTLLFEPSRKGRLLGCFTLVMPLAIRSLYRITFTSAALLLLIATALYLFTRLRAGSVSRRDWWFVLLSTIWAYAWRWKLCLYFTIFFLPCCLYIRQQQRRWAILLVVATVGFAALDRTWDQLDSTNKDRAYLQLYALRGQFHDMGDVRPAADGAALRAAKWSMNDYRMFHDHWMLYDNQRVNIDSLRRFLAGIRQESQANLPRRLRNSLGLAYQSNRWLLLIAVCGVLTILCGSDEPKTENSKRDYLAILLVAAPILLLMVTRFIPRVSVPAMLMGGGMIAVAFPGLTLKPRLFRGLGVTFCLVACLASVRMFWEDWQQNVTEREQREFVMERLAELSLLRDNPLVIRMQPGFGFMASSAHPLQIDPRERKVRSLPAGWQVGSEHYRQALAELNVADGLALLKNAVNNSGIRFILYTPAEYTGRKSLVRDWNEYLRTHVNPKSQLETRAIHRYRNRLLTEYLLVTK